MEEAHVTKTSLDARKQSDIRMVHSVAVKLRSRREEEAAAKRDLNVLYRETEPFRIVRGTEPLPGSVVIAGFGPAGMFAADLLAREGLRPIVLERGGSVEERVMRVEHFWGSGELDPACNVQFGEGGAGTFSDGKLTTRIHDPLCRLCAGAVRRPRRPGGDPSEGETPHRHRSAPGRRPLHPAGRDRSPGVKCGSTQNSMGSR